MTIYVIDDHPLMRDAIAMLLRRLQPDRRIVEAGCLAAFEQRTEGTVPFAIFLDLKLPDALGCSGVAQVRKRFPVTPLAVYSATPAQDVEAACLKAGASIYIEKTADMALLVRAVRVLLCPPGGTHLRANPIDASRFQGRPC